jgi:hypothetical protein
MRRVQQVLVQLLTPSRFTSLQQCPVAKLTAQYTTTPPPPHYAHLPSSRQHRRYVDTAILQLQQRNSGAARLNTAANSAHRHNSF